MTDLAELGTTLLMQDSRTSLPANAVPKPPASARAGSGWWASHKNPRDGWVWILPAALLITFIAAISLLLYLLYRHELELHRNGLTRDIQWAETAIARRLAADQTWLDVLARRLAEGELDQASMVQEAERYLAGNPGIQGIVWTDSSGRIRSVAPQHKQGLAALLEQPPSEELERIVRLSTTMARGTYTQPYRDNEKNLLIQYHAPVLGAVNSGERDLGANQGTVAVTYSLRGIVQQLIPQDVLAKYRFVVVSADGDEVRSLNASPSLTNRFARELMTQSLPMTMPWRDLTLRVTSFRTDSLLAQTVLGTLTIALSLVIVWSLWSARRHLNTRTQAVEAAQASHERFVTVLESLDAAVYVAHFDTGELLFVNQTCRAAFAGSAPGASVLSIEQSLEPAPSVLFSTNMLDARDHNTQVLREECYDPATRRWYALRAKSIRWVDSRTVRMHMLSDITERKQADERSRLQHEKLLQTSRLMSAGEMASTLAHEINQPLAAIANYNMGCVRRLRSGSFDPDDLARAMEKSASQAERAGKIIQRVREFLRTRAPQREVLDLNEAIRDTAELVELECEKYGVRVVYQLDSALPHAIADRVMIEQVLLNLFKNAIEAMRETPAPQRVLTLTTSNHAAREGSISAAVRDCGHGISPHAEDELFSPFFSTKSQGMGMGLNICRSIVELHEGRLWFTRNPVDSRASDAPTGSTFHFTLPVASTLPSIAADACSAPPSTSNPETV